MKGNNHMTMSKEQEKEILYEKRKTGKRIVLDYLIITAASFIYAVAVSLLLDPNLLAPGGVTGIAVIMNRVTKVATGTWIFLINIPIMVVGMWKFGIRFILSTAYAIGAISFFTNLLNRIGAVTDDRFLASVAGGALMAAALGLVFKTGATTGGMDVIIKLLRLRFPHMKTGSLFLITDAAVVILSAFAFQDIEVAMYAGLVVVINSVLLDVVLYGRDGAKLIFIISDHHEAITKRILEELDIGVTYISGQGAYSGKGKNVIMCVMKKQLSPKAEEIIKDEDPLAFMIVTSATEIFGEGYKSIFSERI